MLVAYAAYLAWRLASGQVVEAREFVTAAMCLPIYAGLDAFPPTTRLQRRCDAYGRVVFVPAALLTLFVAGEGMSPVLAIACVSLHVLSAGLLQAGRGPEPSRSAGGGGGLGG
jgi:hypothetical protein